MTPCVQATTDQATWWYRRTKNQVTNLPTKPTDEAFSFSCLRAKRYLNAHFPPTKITNGVSKKNQAADLVMW